MSFILFLFKAVISLGLIGIAICLIDAIIEMFR